jgi:hypothetical protein
MFPVCFGWHLPNTIGAYYTSISLTSMICTLFNQPSASPYVRHYVTIQVHIQDGASATNTSMEC